jgi:hypothetical protein
MFREEVRVRPMEELRLAGCEACEACEGR